MKHHQACCSRFIVCVSGDFPCNGSDRWPCCSWDSTSLVGFVYLKYAARLCPGKGQGSQLRVNPVLLVSLYPSGPWWWFLLDGGFLVLFSSCFLMMHCFPSFSWLSKYSLNIIVSCLSLQLVEFLSAALSPQKSLFISWNEKLLLGRLYWTE